MFKRRDRAAVTTETDLVDVSSRLAAYDVQPTVAVALDVTDSTDSGAPEVDRWPSDGPVHLAAG